MQVVADLTGWPASRLQSTIRTVTANLPTRLFPEVPAVLTFGASDEVWFNPGDGRAYFSLVPNATLQPPRTVAGLGVLDVVNRKSLGITPVAGAQGLHSIAADAHNNRIFMPINDNTDNGAGGIAMLHAAQQKHDSED
jgi:hypothetical protein